MELKQLQQEIGILDLRLTKKIGRLESENATRLEDILILKGRVKELEEARKVQIGINTKLLKEKEPKTDGKAKSKPSFWGIFKR